jgi:hypothetical protein
VVGFFSHNGTAVQARLLNEDTFVSCIPEPGHRMEHQTNG